MESTAEMSGPKGTTTNLAMATDSADVMPGDERLKNTSLILIEGVNKVAMVTGNLAVRACTYFRAPLANTAPHPKTASQRTGKAGKSAKSRRTAPTQTRNPTTRNLTSTMLPYPFAFSLLGAPSRFTMLSAMHDYALLLAGAHPEPTRASFLSLLMPANQKKKVRKSGKPTVVNNHVDKVVDTYAVVLGLMRHKLETTTCLNRFPGIHIPGDQECTGMVKFHFVGNFPGTHSIANTIQTHTNRSAKWGPYAIPPGLDAERYSAIKILGLMTTELVTTGMVSAIILRQSSQEILAPLYRLFHVGISQTQRAALKVQHRDTIITLAVKTIQTHAKSVKMELIPDGIAAATVRASLDDAWDEIDRLAIEYSKPSLTEARNMYALTSCLDAEGNSSNPAHMSSVLAPPSQIQRLHGRPSRIVTCLRMHQPRHIRQFDVNQLPPAPMFAKRRVLPFSPVESK